jgi:hypothetical protein
VAEAYLVDAVRTPVGRSGGGLAGAHPADLGAHVIRALLARTAADPLAVDDVVFGCVDTLGPQAGDIARAAWLAAGLPEAVPGVTVDRQCGSSQQAPHFAAQAVLSGTADLVVVGGVQNMSMIPIAAAMLAGQAYGFADPFSGSDGWRARYGEQEISQFRAALSHPRAALSHPRAALSHPRAAEPRMDVGLVLFFEHQTHIHDRGGRSWGRRRFGLWLVFGEAAYGGLVGRFVGVQELRREPLPLLRVGGPAAYRAWNASSRP